MKRNRRKNHERKISKDISALTDELKVLEQGIDEVKKLMQLLAVNELLDEINIEEKTKH